MKTYITRSQALHHYPITEAELDRLIGEGKIEAVNLIDGDQTQLAIYDDDLAAYVAERDISPEKFDHLRGHLMGIGEAAREYKLSHVTISQWARRGMLTIKRQEGQKKFVDEADVAYLAALGRAKKMRPGKKVFGS
jgi:hypothetical protein